MNVPWQNSLNYYCFVSKIGLHKLFLFYSIPVRRLKEFCNNWMKIWDTPVELDNVKIHLCEEGQSKGCWHQNLTANDGEKTETQNRRPPVPASRCFRFFSNFFFRFCLYCLIIVYLMFIISLVIYGPVCVPHVFRVKSVKQDTYRPVSRTE